MVSTVSALGWVEGWGLELGPVGSYLVTMRVASVVGVQSCALSCY